MVSEKEGSIDGWEFYFAARIFTINVFEESSFPLRGPFGRLVPTYPKK